MARPPAVAGLFYPREPEALGKLVRSLLVPPVSGKLEPVVAVLVPHAGYAYSGAVAGEVYGAVRIPDRVVLLGPNHTGVGPPISLWNRGAWEIPGWTIPIDESMGRLLQERDGEVQPDESAHRKEHGLEVQLPFLIARAPGLRVTPLVVGTWRIETLAALGRALAGAISAAGEEVLLVVSSDMTHYEPAGEAERKDLEAVAAMVSMDVGELERVVRRERLSMCGYAPAVAGILAARELGARSGCLIRYSNSGKVTGDDTSVVGYAGMTFS